MAVRVMGDGSFFLVQEPENGRHAPSAARIVAADGTVLSRRRHGYRARLDVTDESGENLPTATLLRAAAAVGRALERVSDPLEGCHSVRLGPSGTPAKVVGDRIDLDGPWISSQPIHHPVDAHVETLLRENPASPTALPAGPQASRSARRVLFFESLMNSDLPHNDCELSQGVLHMASSLSASGTDVVLANVKMAIVGEERPVVGLDSLNQALSHGPIDLVCITLLEGYFDGVVGLIRELRRLGCRAHVAVGGVMPTLTPEHVAAHLPDVTFVCRGAGEYYVPRLAALVGRGSIDQPLDAEQRRLLMAMDGILAIDRAGHRLVAGNPDKVVSVESLDRVALDLSLIQPRHLEQGVELSTSRGCVHKCTFCSIIGRQSYQARSSEGVFELLGRYQERYRELFGDDIPRNAFRIHISDDDFACDRPRAANFFRELLSTPFRLASAQVSVADLCKRDGKWLLPEPDPELVSFIRPECFADVNAPIPTSDFVADHRSRRWSAYLQIGVETFSDAELRRLGKGYDLAHIRAIVKELAGRRIHMDAYLILANVETSATDLADSIEELCRLKLRYPTFFHVRFPVVPRLVSYFPSASHRRLVRKGQRTAMRLRGEARVAGHPELDYPFVEADEPRDPWVRAVDASLFTDGGFYTKTLEALRTRYLELHADGVEELSAERERLLRRLDDRPRRLAFEMLYEAQESREPEREAQALATADLLLGERASWLPTYKRYASQSPSRLVVIPTWQCELRCVYCYIPKQDGRVMTKHTLERSVDFLLSSDRKDVILQYFGGEALIEYGLVQHGIEYGLEQAKLLGKNISFILSSNGWSLDEEKLSWLAARPVKLELSLDGAPDVQNLSRPSRVRHLDSYREGIAPRAEAIVRSGLPHEVIMVVVPKNVDRMPENFFHIADLGFRRIQINFALGVQWSKQRQQLFAQGLHRIGEELRARWARGEKLDFINLENAPMPVRLNGEVTVDYDGTIYGGNGFLHETEHKSKFLFGHLDDLTCFDRHVLEGPDNGFLLEYGYPPEVTANNRAVGAIMASFVRWMKDQDQRPPAHAEATQAAPAAR